MSSTGIMIKEKDVIYMELSVSIAQNQLKELLLQVGLVRPVFIWGAPGIGKSAIVEQFAAELGLPCVCLTGSQLAPEDLIGVPQIVNGTSVFCPPRCLVQKEPFCLFLDELNACSLEVQKAFYSLILERRIGEYHLPDGSIVVGAGNRMQDNAITRQLPSALILYDWYPGRSGACRGNLLFPVARQRTDAGEARPHTD